MSEILKELTPYLLGIAGVLLTYLGRKLSLFLNEKISKEQWALIKDIVEGAVKFVEQVSKQDITLKGEAKFELAKKKAIEVLNDEGLMVTETQLEILIESFVLSIEVG